MMGVLSQSPALLVDGDPGNLGLQGCPDLKEPDAIFLSNQMAFPAFDVRSDLPYTPASR